MLETKEHDYPVDTQEALRQGVTQLVVIVPEQCVPNSFGYAAGRKTINGIMDLSEEYLKNLKTEAELYDCILKE